MIGRDLSALRFHGCTGSGEAHFTSPDLLALYVSNHYENLDRAVRIAREAALRRSPWITVETDGSELFIFWMNPNSFVGTRIKVPAVVPLAMGGDEFIAMLAEGYSKTNVWFPPST